MIEVIRVYLSQSARLFGLGLLIALVFAVFSFPFGLDDSDIEVWRKFAISTVDSTAKDNHREIVQRTAWLGSKGLQEEGVDQSNSLGPSVVTYALLGTIQHGSDRMAYIMIDYEEFAAVKVGDVMNSGGEIKQIRDGEVKIQSSSDGELLELRLYEIVSDES